MHQKLYLTREQESGGPTFKTRKDSGVFKPTVLNINKSTYMTESVAACAKDAAMSDSPYCRLKRIRLPNNETLELAILAWYNIQTSSGVKIRGVDIQEKASAIAKEMGEEGFVASSGWLWKFKLRNGIKITMRTNYDKEDHGSGKNEKFLDCGEGVMVPTEAESKNGLVKRKRASLTVSQKLRILDELENGLSPSNICAKYGIARQTVSDIRKRKDKLRRFASDFNTSNMNERRSIYEACQDKPLDELLWIDGALVEVKVEENDDTITVEGDTVTYEQDEGDGILMEEDPCDEDGAQLQRITVSEAHQKLEVMKESPTRKSLQSISKECDIAQSTESVLLTNTSHGLKRISDAGKNNMSYQASGSTTKCGNTVDTSEKRKRVNVTIAQKLAIIEKLETGVSVANICTKYGIKKQTVSDIKKSKSKLELKLRLSLQKEAGKLVKQGSIVATDSDSTRKSTQDSISDPGKEFSAKNSLYYISESGDLSSKFPSRASGTVETNDRPVDIISHHDLSLEAVSHRRTDQSDENRHDSDLLTNKNVWIKEENIEEQTEKVAGDEEGWAQMKEIEDPTAAEKFDNELFSCDENVRNRSDKSSSVDNAVYQWYIEEYKRCDRVNPQDILANATRLARSMRARNFTANVKWLCGFKYRYMLDDEMLSLEEIDSTRAPRVRLTVAQKIAILEKLDRGDSVTKVSAEFGVAKQTVSGIRKIRGKIEAYAGKNDVISNPENSSQCGRKVIRAPDALDEAVHKWYLQEQSRRGKVSGRELQETARRLAHELGVENFSASSGWLWKFRTRHGLVIPKESQEATRSTASNHSDMF